MALLPKARERKRVPLSRISPCLLDREASVVQQGAERFRREFVAALGMDGFKGRELDAKLRGRNIYTLIARALQVHLHARLHAIPAGSMPEAGEIKVRTEFSVEAVENVQIERRSDARSVVICPPENRLVFYHIRT
jgi:hypothetical protein